jgi:3-dehydroquinate synthase
MPTRCATPERRSAKAFAFVLTCGIYRTLGYKYCAMTAQADLYTGHHRPALDSITVQLDSGRSYDILINYGWLSRLGSALQQRGNWNQAMVFTSPRIGGHYYQEIRRSLEDVGFSRVARHDIPDGEQHKNMAHFEKCLEALAGQFPEPGTVPLVINLGGGVVGDVGGFAASTYRRGIPYVQVPTTLLGFVDCGIGGKVGVNLSNIKNIVGAFWQPKLVFSDLAVLKTLDAREVRSGVAEVIKYGTVCDQELFGYLEESIEKLLSLDRDTLLHVVGACYRLKADVVRKDERDTQGIRMVLNFGHTIGHALEMAANYQMTHGEAISVGMLAATQIAIRLRLCKANVYDRLRALILRAGLPEKAAGFSINSDQVLAIMQHDKKSENGKNRFVLPTNLGTWVREDGVPEDLVREVIETYI